MTRAQHDEPLVALLEQGEAIVAGWLESLSDSALVAEGPCPDEGQAREYAFGRLPGEEALAVASHLAACTRCRNVERTWRILCDAQTNAPECSLEALREIARKRPEEAARALARVSRRIEQLVSPFPFAEEPGMLEAPVLPTRGEASGEVVALSLEGWPRLDPAYQFRTRFRTEDQTFANSRIRILLRDQHGSIEIGAVALRQGFADAVFDLSDLCLRPGFIAGANLKILVAQEPKEYRKDPGALIETQPRVASSVVSDTIYAKTITDKDLAQVREGPGRRPEGTAGTRGRERK